MSCMYDGGEEALVSVYAVREKEGKEGKGSEGGEKKGREFYLLAIYSFVNKMERK